jgi:dihydroorotate dehydrogenase electron transfer subunit
VAQVVEAPVVENCQFPNHNHIVVLRASEIAKEVLPGQFVMASCAGDEALPHPLLKRAMAVYTVKRYQGEESLIALLIKVVGDGTHRLANAKPGDSINLIGPLGNGFDLERAKGRINFLVVGGTGIASVYLLAKHLSHYGESVHLVYGGQNAEALVGLDDFRKLGIPIVTATEDASSGFPGLVTDGFLDYLDRFPISQANIYTCGPNLMMQAVTEMALKRGIPCQISVESKMACGFGVCLGCTVKTTGSYRLACTDGPVFDASEFVWENSRPLMNRVETQ